MERKFLSRKRERSSGGGVKSSNTRNTRDRKRSIDEGRCLENKTHAEGRKKRGIDVRGVS